MKLSLGIILVCLLSALLTACHSVERQNLPVPSMKSGIRVGTYNVKDLFDTFDDPATDDGPPADNDRIEALGKVITAIDCDIISLEEVENLEFLQNFNTEYLHGLYTNVVLIKGPDPRGINVGVMSKFPLEGIKSFKGPDVRQIFSRDLLAVSWIGQDGSKWTLLTAHLKSGATSEDSQKRKNQTEAIAEICRDEGYIDRWGHGLVILAGDLNALPWSDELRPLSQVPFSDPARDLPVRRTHKSGKVFDYILLSPDADADYVIGSTTVYRDSPTSKASDHYPVYLDLK
jgi:endonuclease/exonuclease/phosphatase family metal-dependent hydrolase